MIFVIYFEFSAIKLGMRYWIGELMIPTNKSTLLHIHSTIHDGSSPSNSPKLLGFEEPNRLRLIKKHSDESKMLKSMFTCSKVYISETRNKSALESIEQAAKLFPQAAIVNKFEDETYNRVGYTLVSKSAPTLSPDSCPLKNAVFSMVKAAFEAIDFGLHTGSHPRLGVVDHICFHPLASTSLEQVAGTAKALAVDVGSVLKVPTYTYGAAHNTQRSLDSIRRALGYFNPNTPEQHWSGGLQSTALPLEPDHGPAQAVQSKGVITIGATKWVDNYNVPVFCTDMATVRRIAKRVSQRGGGLTSVQSMALVHGEVIEVACNLLNPGAVGGDQVQAAVEKVGLEEGVLVGKGYFTDLSQEEIIQTYLDLHCS